MKNKNNQIGASSLGMMLIVLAIIFSAITLMKLWSPYYDDMAVKTALKNITEEDATRTMAPKEIRQTVNRRLQVNQVTLDAESILIKKVDGMLHIDIIYERRIPMYGNIDAIVKFNHSAKVNIKG